MPITAPVTNAALADPQAFAADGGRPPRPGTRATVGVVPTVVGITVARDSVETLARILGDLPAQSGLCFVVVAQPGVRGRLLTRLARLAHLDVALATDGVALRVNHVYIVATGHSASLHHGRLRCASDGARGEPVFDNFLRSLAEDCGAHAVGVVLAGCGPHGVLGCRAVRMAGGMTLTQRPENAEPGAQPLAVTDGGAFDFRVAPREVAPLLLRHAGTKPRLPAARGKLRDAVLDAVPGELRAEFAACDPALLARCAARRMRVLGIDAWRRYCAQLESEPREARALRQEFAYRGGRLLDDGERLAVIVTHLAAAFLARVDDSRPLRVWVPGCGSGEQAYSIALLLHEAFAALGHTPRVLVFATSADADAIAAARRGIFPATIAADVGAARLRRHFVRSGDDALRVRDTLRASLVFSVHKLFVDPPFSQMDLIVGRELLASLAAEARVKALALFQFALCASGCLLLGSRDRAGAVGDKFVRVKGQRGLWRRADGGRHDGAPPAPARPETPEVRLRNALNAQYLPAAVLIDERYAVLSSAGPVLDYLHALPSDSRQDLRGLLRPGLRSRVLRLCRQAWRDSRESRDDAGRVENEHGAMRCVLTVRPLAGADGVGQLAVIFDRPSAPAAAPPALRDDDKTPRPRLLDELRTTRQDLRTTSAELQVSREEFRASTEEMLSVNEELRSTNEELENTEDELRTANQALNISNQVLAAKIEQLEHINDDINNLVASTDIATLMLDMELCIQRYTPAIQRVLPVLPDDVGRPLSDFSARFDIAALVADCRQVIASQAERSREFELANSKAPHGRDNAWFVCRVLPYRTRSLRPGGVVVTFTDVSARKQRELALARSHQDLANLLAVLDQSVSAIGDAVVVSDLHGGYLRFNDAAQQLFGVDPRELPPHQWPGQIEFYAADAQTRVAADDLPLARAMAGRFLAPTELFVRTPSRREGCWCVAMAAPVHDGDGNYAAVAVFRDITEKKRAEQQLRASEGRLRAILDTMQEAVITTDVNGAITSINRAAEQMFGYTQGELAGSLLGRLLASTATFATEHEAEPGRFGEDLDGNLSGAPRKLAARHKVGKLFPVNLSIRANTSLGMFTAVLRDMSAEQALQRLVIEAAEGEQRRIGEVLHDQVQQQLSSLGFITGALLETLPADATAARDLAQRLEAGLSLTIGDIQRLARGLVPAEIETHGLRDALLNLVSKTTEETRVACQLDYDDNLQIGNASIANQLFRIVAEGVANALKHSGARSIRVALRADGDELVLSIEDDGSGIAPDTDFSASAGVRIMRYRAETLGGQLAFGASPSGGALLTYTGPCR